jgi:hypothetical protein
MAKILIIVLFIQNEALKMVANIGMLFLANSLCVKMFTLQTVGARLIIEMLKMVKWQSKVV